MDFDSSRRKTEHQDLLHGMPSPLGGLVKAKPLHGTTLTARQWEVIRYRAHGLTQAEVAEELNTSRENVSEIEHRVRLKIDAARATLAALQQIDATSQLLIPSGISEYEALSMIILRADILGVKLLNSSDDILAALRSKCKGRIRAHHLTSVVRIGIGSSGRLSFNTTI